jgi:localization factor PodJL
MSMLQEMLAGFMDERRRGEAMTADALETMQQALQHMLDRVDAIEAAQFAPLQPALPQSVQLEAMRATPPPAPLAPAELPRGAGPAPRSFAEEAKAAARLAAAAEATARAQARPAVADLDAGRIEPRLEDPAAADPDRTTAHIVREPARDARAAARPSAPPDRSAFIAMARRAAEQVKSDPDSGTAANGPPAAPARGASLKYRLFGGGEAGSARSGVRPGVLLVASLAFFLFAGYWFVASPRFRTIGASPPVQRGAVVPADPKAQPRPAASPAIESEAPPLPKEAAPQPTAPEAPPRRRRSVPETGVDDLGALPRREDHATLPHSVAAPGAPAAPGPTYGIALQQGPRQPTPEEIIRSRQTAHLASLSQRTAHDAARTASVPASHVPSGVLDPAPGDNPAAPAQAAPPARQTVELPPAAIGPLSLRLAAAKGDPSAQFDVAARFAEGRGVKQDFEQAAQWYQRAATQGLAQAQYRLAALHERGLGVKGEPARARIWYKRAAEQGNLKAMHNLAVMSTGRDGAPADYPAAIQWFAEAAERGLTDSQFNLGVLHESGLGAGRDVVAAYKWYALAARGGDKEALRRRDLLASKLDAASLAAGEAAVAQWRPRAVDALANDPRAAGDAWKQRAAAGQGQ